MRSDIQIASRVPPEMARKARSIGCCWPHHVAHRIVTSPHVRTDALASYVIDPTRLTELIGSAKEWWGMLSDLASFQTISMKVESLTVDFRLG